MDNLIDKLIDYYKKGTEGIKIIYFCVISSFIYWTINFILKEVLNFSLAPYLLLSADSFFPRVWTIFTFLFIHENIWDLLFVMIMIYFTEMIFRNYFNGENYIKFFFLGSIAGGILFLLYSFLTEQTFVYLRGGTVLGVYSTLFAIISYHPKIRIILFPLPVRLPLYVLGLILLGLDVFSMISLRQITPLFVAKLGAAAFGYFYMKSFQSGNDFLGKLIPFSRIYKIDSIFKRFGSHSRRKKSTNQQTYNFTGSQPNEKFNANTVEKQKRIDTILDKISKSGYNSLTKEEKDFLFNSSQ
ncbi:MAG: rhomboid family intramembrane serine protease [Flavobacteriaceae bacterium]|jgi:membrane associated rhomboid family serine protease|nr:rhomboid family intramembrane serine protease [Flavobacteriaceae bacterium]